MQQPTAVFGKSREALHLITYQGTAQQQACLLKTPCASKDILRAPVALWSSQQGERTAIPHPHSDLRTEQVNHQGPIVKYLLSPKTCTEPVSGGPSWLLKPHHNDTQQRAKAGALVHNRAVPHMCSTASARHAGTHAHPSHSWCIRLGPTHTCTSQGWNVAACHSLCSRHSTQPHLQLQACHPPGTHTDVRAIIHAHNHPHPHRHQHQRQAQKHFLSWPTIPAYLPTKRIGGLCPALGCVSTSVCVKHSHSADAGAYV